MTGSTRWRILCAALVLSLLGPVAARGAGQTPFLDAANRAYPHLKMAWFYTRTGSGAVATMEIEAFRDAWAGIAERFADNPPPRFKADKQWRASLAAVTAATGRALAFAEADRLREAHETLGEVRRALSNLRRRNNVTVFADLVEAYGEQVARLVQLRKELKELGKLTPGHLDRLRRISAALKASLVTVRDGAPAALRSNPGFSASIAGNVKSIAKLDRGIRRKNLKAIRGSVSAVRSDYVLLFTRYG